MRHSVVEVAIGHRNLVQEVDDFGEQRSIGCFRLLALFSFRVCRSSRRRSKARHVICSMTSSGFEIPLDQNAFQNPTIWLRSSPANIGRSLQRTVTEAQLAKC